MQESEQLLKMQKSPWLINKLTQNMLQLLSQIGVDSQIPWETMLKLMQQASQEDISIQKFMLLFNVVKNVIADTFPDIAIQNNKIYQWIGLLYGWRSNYCLSLLQQQIRTFQLSTSQSTNNESEIRKYTCYGLIIHQIMISLIENTNRKNTSNRVFISQLYRFASLTLQFIARNKKLDTSICISPQKQNKPEIEQINEQNKNQSDQLLTMKTTDILKLSAGQKNRNDKKAIKMRQKLVWQMIVMKILELLPRSFQLCRTKSLKKMNIISQIINGHIKNIVKLQNQVQKHSSDRKQFVENGKGENLQQVALEYLQLFKQKTVQAENNGIDIEVEQQNKIIQVKQLTPKFVDEGPAMQLKKLRVKKKKLIKKIQSDARTANRNKLQERKVIEDVRNERIHKKQKKQIFILQKQTEQAKKQHKKMKRVRQIRKQGKNSGKGGKR